MDTSPFIAYIHTVFVFFCCPKNCHNITASDKAHLFSQFWRLGWAQDGSPGNRPRLKSWYPSAGLHSFLEALRTSLHPTSQLNSVPVGRCRTKVPFLAGSQPRLGFAPRGCPRPFSCFACGPSTNSRSRPPHTLHLSVQLEKMLFFKCSCN